MHLVAQMHIIICVCCWLMACWWFEWGKEVQGHLSICKGALGMLMEGHHEVPKLAVGKGTVGIHTGSLQDLGVDLAQPPFQVIQQDFDC